VDLQNDIPVLIHLTLAHRNSRLKEVAGWQVVRMGLSTTDVGNLPQETEPHEETEVT